MTPLAAFRHSGREQVSPVAWTLTLAAAALMLCSVALLNGGPIMYNDTTAYLLDANFLFHRHAPYAVRPVFYGIVIWLLWEISPFARSASLFLPLFVQAFVLAHIIYLTLRVVGAAIRPASFLLLIAALVLFTPVSFHASHLLPDIFVAVLTLAVFLLAFCSDSLHRWEAAYLFLLAAAATTFHLTSLPVGVAIVGLAILLALAGQRWSRPLTAARPLALGAAAILAFSVLVFQRLTLEPNGPPHLLARVLADGPGVDYLRATCPGSGLTLCRYLDRFPLTEDGFMWLMLPSVPTADGYKIIAEQRQVVRGTLAMFPAEIAWHALSNSLRQLVTFGAETQFSPAEWAKFRASGLPWASAFGDTWQSRGALDGKALNEINAIQAGLVVISLLVALGTLPRLLAARLTRPATLTATVLLVLLTNAIVCGAIGGVFARYQGRLIWLLPLTASISVICLLKWRTRYDSNVRPLPSEGSALSS